MMFKRIFCLLCVAASIGLVSLNGFCEDNSFSDSFKKGVGEELGRAVTRAIIDAVKSKDSIQNSCVLSLRKPFDSPFVNEDGLKMHGSVVENNYIKSSGEFALIVYATNQQSYSGGKIIGIPIYFSRFDHLRGQSTLDDVTIKKNYLIDDYIVDENVKLDKENRRFLVVLSETCSDGEIKMVDFAYLF